ncbi:MAG: MFS transporter [Steroidobacteraceae bacterium]|nr:MFS transporter [Steroidobacteraceae bacterium]MDW8260825.1 MFS transporter [Gammaproteobacteria bacterium]
MTVTDPRAADAATALTDGERRLTVLLLIVFVDLLGFGVLIPLIPFYATRLGMAPGAVTVIVALHSLAQLLCAPPLGRLSDRYGRRPILAFSMAGHAAAYGMLAVADSVTVLVLSRLLSGATSANLAAAYAGVTDILPPERRAVGFARVSAAFALGFTFGPVLGGWLSGGAEPAVANLVRPALVAGGLSLLALLGILLWLPETRPAAAPAAALRRMPPVARRPGTDRLRPWSRDRPLALLLALTVMVLLCAAMRESLLSLWLHDRLHFDTDTIGVVFTVNGAVIALVQSKLTGWLAHRCGAMLLLRAGIASYGLSWLGLTLAPDLAWVLAAIVVGAFGTAFFATGMQSLIAARASAEARGVVMGWYQSSASLARFVGAASAGTLYGAWGHDAPFLLGALLMIPALGITWRIAVLSAAAPRAAG